MTDHAAVRAGDEAEAAALLARLALQAARRGGYPSPSGGSTWSNDDAWDLVAHAYDRKGDFVEIANISTTDDRGLELYLLRVFENLLRDQARATERGKLVGRIETILGPIPRFCRHTTPYNAWRLDSCADGAWQGDVGHLIRAASRLRGVTATAWNTAGPTPRTTRDAIVRVAEAALTEADGFVRDGDVAHVIQVCVPAVPSDPVALEVPLPDAPSTASEHAASAVHLDSDPTDATAEETAAAIWANLTHDERRSVPFLDSARAVADELGLPRRTATAITESARAKTRAATTEGHEAAVIGELRDLSLAFFADCEEGVS
jgi:hypothetical protein